MKARRILSSITVLAMIIGMLSVCALAAEETADTDVYAIGDGQAYETFSAAVAAAADNDGDGAITYEIYGKVDIDKTGWVSPRGTSGAAAINFIGKTADAELCIPTAAATVIAVDTAAGTAAMTFTDLICSRPYGAWVGDLGHANNYFTAWIRGAESGVVTYTRCKFLNGTCNNQYGKTVYTDCSFDNPKEYALWVYGGEVEVTGSDFTGAKGVKIYSENAAAEVLTTITGSTFDGIVKKPAVVATQPGTVTLSGITVENCEYGVLANELHDGRSELGHADVTIDGEMPEYVAILNGNLHTSMAYAEAEANEGDTIEAPVAQVGNLVYTSLDAAFQAAEEGATITLLADAEITEAVELKKAITIDLNGNTLDMTAEPNTSGFYPELRMCSYYINAGVTFKNGTINVTNSETNADHGVFFVEVGDFLAFDNITLISDGENTSIYLTSTEQLVNNSSTIEATMYVLDEEGGEPAVYHFLAFDTGDGSEIDAVSALSGEKIDLSEYTPELYGYTFDGWYADAGLTEAITSVTLDSNITVYAKWTEKTTIIGTTPDTTPSTGGSGGGLRAGGDTSKTGADELIPEEDTKSEDTDSTSDTPDTDVTAPTVWSNPFADVAEGDWYFEDVKYAYDNGLMNGTASDAFSPNGGVTRAMLVTVLWRAEGEPAAGDDANIVPFEDVADGMYYADAVAWAQVNGIVNGVSEAEFAPDKLIIREQIAAIMHRYAAYKGYDVSAAETADISSFADYGSISEYAIPSLRYAIGTGLINGKTATEIAPMDTATRAETAAILQRFIEINK